jgi:hypothetical protein
MPKELNDVRTNLREFENSPENRDGLRHLSAAIGLLLDIIEGDHLEGHKQIANNLMTAYKAKVILKVKVILKHPEAYGPNILRYWHDVTEEFTESGFEEDQEMKSYQDQLFVLWFKSLLNAMKPKDRQFLLNELNKKDEAKIKE